MRKNIPTVVVIGELNIDLVLWEVAMPEYEQEKIARDMRFAMGSSSAISAHNLAAIGGAVGFIGKVGKDNLGYFMIDRLSQGGVDTSQIIQDDSLKTGATIVLANPPKKALLTYLGAIEALTLQDINWDYVAQYQHLHLGCFFLQTGIRKEVAKLFKKAKSLGLTTSMDTNWDPDDQWGEDLLEALAYTDIFLPNDDEALRIARTNTLDSAIQFLQKEVNTFAIKKGEAGAVGSREGVLYSHPGFKMEAVETTGAGDSFNAGFLYQFLQGSNMEECLRWGNACGAIAVTALGGSGAFTNRHNLQIQLDRLLKNEYSSLEPN